MADVAVVLKLAPFWSADPALWFAQTEAQFATRNITTELTKFRHIVATLAPEVATEVRDLLLQPPAQTYTALKEALIKRVGVSEDVRLTQLLQDEPLGDRRPSQLLRRMRQLLGAATMDDTILRRIFIQRLPPACRAILAGRSDVTDLNQLADIADDVIDATIHTTAAAAIPPVPVAVLSAMQNDINALRRNLQSRGQGATSPSQQHQRRPGLRDLDTNGLCWYHSTFGATARKCRDGCSYARPGNDCPAQ